MAERAEEAAADPATEQHADAASIGDGTADPTDDPAAEPITDSPAAEPPDAADAGPRANGAAFPSAPGAIAPPPWRDWAEIRSFRQRLFADRFLLLRRPEHLDAIERAELERLFASPMGETLRLARAFLEEWDGFWRDEMGGRPTIDDTRRRYEVWRDNAAYRTLAPLKRILERFDTERFAQVSRFLEDSRWEATNNGAERAGRAFRHGQAPHFHLRTPESIDVALKARVMRQVQAQRCTERAIAGYANRGRRRRTGNPESVAA
jgi:hypothetical protein